METTLNFEELGNHTRPPLRATDTAFLNILGVVGRDDVLARLRVVHDGLGVREETVEAPVEDAGRDEGVDVADAETVFWVDLVSIATNVITSSCARCWMGVKAFGRKGKRMGEKKGLQVLPANRNAGLAIARCNDVVNEARKWWNAADEEGGYGAPIASVFG